MSFIFIIKLLLFLICIALIIYEIVKGDKNRDNEKQSEYTLALNGRSCTIRLTKKEARAVRSCVSQYNFENSDTGLSFVVTKILD